MAVQAAEIGISLMLVDSEREGLPLKPVSSTRYVICSGSAIGKH
jgi:hypothetical protein